MDKYEYKLRAEEIRQLIAQKEYAEAVQIADTIDWRRVKSVLMLCMVSDLYKINRRFEESRELLLLAYDRHPGGRTIVYSLCELSIKMGDTVQAIEYYKEYVQLAPKDTGRYILQYKLYEAQEVSLEERIEVLEEFKKRDYREKWAYELAYLYHRVGLATKCTEECDQLILWFGKGKYVIKAMELKMLHEPLTAEQEEKYHELKAGKRAKAEKAETPQRQETPTGQERLRRQQAQREAQGRGDEPAQFAETPGTDPALQPQETLEKELDIQIKPIHVGQYDTINLQKALAENLRELERMENEQRAAQQQEETPQEAAESQEGALSQETAFPQEGAFPQETAFPQEGTFSQEAAFPQETAFPQEAAFSQGEMPAQETVSAVPSGDTMIYQPIRSQSALSREAEPVLAGAAASEEAPEEVFVEAPEDIPEAAAEEAPETLPGAAEASGTEESEAYVPGAYTREIIAPLLQNTDEMRPITPDMLEQAGQESEAAGFAAPAGAQEIPAGKIEKSEEIFFDDGTAEIPKEAVQEAAARSGAVQQPEGQIAAAAGAAVQQSARQTAAAAGAAAQQSEGQTAAAAGAAAQQTAGQTAAAAGAAAAGAAVQKPAGQITVRPAASLELKPEIARLLSQEYDGQIRLVVPEQETVEKQITGQLSIEDVLAEWERMKKENEQKRAEENKKRVLEHTGSLLADFDNSLKNGVLETLQAAAELTPSAAQTASGAHVSDAEEDRLQRMLDAVSGNGVPQPETAEEESALAQAEEERIEEPIEEAQAETTETEAPLSASEEEAPAAEAQPEEGPAGSEGPARNEEPEEAELEGAQTIVLEETAELPAHIGQAMEAAIEAASDVQETGELPQEPGGLTAQPDPGQAEVEKEQKAGTEAEDETKTNAPVRALTDEEKDLYSSFIQTKREKNQIIHAVDNMSLAPYTGNILITGDAGVEKIELAKNLIKEMQLSDANFSGKVAKITGKALNQKNVEATISRLANGALIVEAAGALLPETLQAMNRALEKDKNGVMIIMEDTKKAMNHMLEGCGQILNNFTSRIDIEALSNDALVAYAKRYARELEYSIDEMGTLALYTRIADMQTSEHVVTAAEVREIIDDAIYHAGKKNIRHLTDIITGRRYDDEDMIILKEQDFAF